MANKIDDLVRIISISDVIESVSAMRPYRKALGLNKALQILDDGRNKYFDSSMVDVVHHIMAKYRDISDVFNEKLIFHELGDEF